MPPGMFIVIEGPDGCGKGTQIELLQKYMTEQLHLPVERVFDPGTSPLGLKLREMLLDKEVRLSPHMQAVMFSAARAALVEDIRHTIARGINVLSDRWWLSTWCYQSTDGVDTDAIAELHRTCSFGFDPSAWVYLAVDLHKLRKRKSDQKQGEEQKDRYESRDEVWYRTLLNAYGKAAACNSDFRKHARGEFVVINGDADPFVVHTEVVKSLVINCRPFAQHFANARI